MISRYDVQKIRNVLGWYNIYVYVIIKHSKQLKAIFFFSFETTTKTK